MAGDSVYEISKFYPQLNQYYGLLVGPAHTIPTAIFGLLAGALTKTGNRKMMLLGVLTILSSFQFAFGMFDSFALYMTLKVVSQALAAAISPIGFSILADYFPADQRTTANSILSSAKVVGIALSSISILLIQKIGWRASYLTIGGVGLFGVLLGLVGLKSTKIIEQKV
jgi:MFS family permease